MPSLNHRYTKLKQLHITITLAQNEQPLGKTQSDVSGFDFHIDSLLFFKCLPLPITVKVAPC